MFANSAVVVYVFLLLLSATWSQPWVRNKDDLIQRLVWFDYLVCCFRSLEYSVGWEMRNRSSALLNAPHIHNHTPGVNVLVVSDTFMECFSVGFMSYRDPLFSALQHGLLRDCCFIFNVITDTNLQIPKGHLLVDECVDGWRSTECWGGSGQSC